MIKRALILVLMLAVGLAVLWCPASVMARQEPPICSFKDHEGNLLLTPRSEEWRAAGCDMSTSPEDPLFAKVPGAVQAVFFLAGIIAAGVIIFGGVRYTISQGDPGKVKKAKDTIMYAVIGLVVTLTAFAIVAFVLEGIG